MSESVTFGVNKGSGLHLEILRADQAEIGGRAAKGTTPRWNHADVWN